MTWHAHMIGISTMDTDPWPDTHIWLVYLPWTHRIRAEQILLCLRDKSEYSRPGPARPDPITLFNPRPDTVFRHLRSDRGGSATPPLGVSKRSVVELSGKDQQIALAEYSRLVVLFLVLGQYLTQLWQVKCQIFGNSVIFQLYESISAKLLSIVAAWDLHQRVPRSILHRMRCFDASLLNI